MRALSIGKNEKRENQVRIQCPSQSKAGPRQHYGMDFYGLMKGEVLVIVDLFTRETILQWLPSRKQEQVAHTVLRRIIFERGVPLSIRSDNALELLVSNARARKTRESFKQFRERKVCEKEGGKTQPNFSPP